MSRILDLAQIWTQLGKWSRKGEGDIVKISNVDISTESEKLSTVLFMSSLCVDKSTLRGCVAAARGELEGRS